MRDLIKNFRRLFPVSSGVSKTGSNSDEMIRLDCEPLEQRLMLSGISFDAGTGIISIEGTSLADSAAATMLNADTVQVVLIGIDTQTFDLAQVNSILFKGFDGNDTFNNFTAINSHMIGGNGNDTLNGGSGQDLIIGNDGRDQLNGGDGEDTIHGGNHDDEIMGGNGNDLLSGQNGNDTLRGEAGNDRLIGGNGNDTMHGGDHNDIFDGMSGDDTMYGDNGFDIMRGAFGDDEIHGGNGDDIIKGHFDNDKLFGDAGFDRIFGFTGQDELNGGDDRDFLYGNEDNDLLIGGLGNDSLIGGDGDDDLRGQEGADVLRGDAGDDILYGGDHDDRINGGDGNDKLYGENGNDSLFGDDGDDWLYGAAGNDRLFGRAGDDALIGGHLSGIDTNYGEAGDDRILVQANDIVHGQQTNDAVLVFENVSSNWSEAEILTLDEGFAAFHDFTNNTVLLRDSLPSGDLTFYKYQTLPSGAPASNFLSWTSQTNCGPNGCETTYTYTREIRFADWDETNNFLNSQFPSIVQHEIAHNWDSERELSNYSSSLAGYWDQFLAKSDWVDTDPQSSQYSLSTDGQWWHLNSASFAVDYGKSNPYEDSATIWQYYFDDYQTGHNRPDLNSKLEWLDTLIQSLTS